jgi:hypothetical protein
MATIAKLDSNGVQVLPEGRGKTTSPQVHSSTDLTTNATGLAEGESATESNESTEWEEEEEHRERVAWVNHWDRIEMLERLFFVLPFKND